MHKITLVPANHREIAAISARPSLALPFLSVSVPSAMSAIETIVAEVSDLTRQEAELKASLVVVGARLKVARQRLERAEAEVRVKQESSSSSSSSESGDGEGADVGEVVSGVAVKAELVTAGGTGASESVASESGLARPPDEVAEAGTSAVVGEGADVDEVVSRIAVKAELVTAGGSGASESVAKVDGCAGPDEQGLKRRRLPQRPVGYCLRCWYVHHQVPGGPSHTRDRGCFAGS